jgi:hypothetical protein
MLTIAGLCVLFGVWNALPLRHLVEPVLGAARMEGQSFAGWPHSTLLVVLTVVALVFAVLHHLWGARRAGSGLGAADHIHHAPVLGAAYAQAEAGHFDPYEIGLKLVAGLARVAWWIDRGIDFIYNRASVSIAAASSYAIRIAHTGSHAAYLLWALAGVAVIVILMLGGI